MPVKPFELKKNLDVVLLKEAEEYFNSLPQKIKNKFAVAFFKTKNRYRGDWFEKLKGTNGIFEFRCRDQNKFYRIFAFWDKDGLEETLIIGTHGFDKKSNKTPSKEIKRAEVIKENYFNSKTKL